MHPAVMKQIRELQPGDVMQTEGPFDTKDPEKGALDVAVLKRRGDEQNPMFDVEVSMFGIWLCDATMKVQKDRVLVHVTKDTRNE